MRGTIGVDPGINGALAKYWENGALQVDDIPTYTATVGGKKRERVQPIDLQQWFEVAAYQGCDLAIIEQVSGRKGQAAGAGFVFGATFGMIYQACVSNKIAVHLAAPQVWKKKMRVPGKMLKGKTNPVYEGEIINMADRLFPHFNGLWRGPRGGKLLDRAEAALLAIYGADNVRSSLEINVRDPKQWRSIYEQAAMGE